MTPSEKRELEVLARRPGAAAWVLPALCWILTAFDLMFLVSGHMRGFQIFAFGLVLCVTIISTLKLWQGFRLKAQVLYDLDIGTLLTNREDGEEIEHLPTSSLLWSENGRPAEWRRKLLSRKIA
jgi:hypothetical protein